MKRQENPKKIVTFARMYSVMGIDVGHIVKHNFTNYEDRKAIILYMKEALENLRRFYARCAILFKCHHVGSAPTWRHAQNSIHEKLCQKSIVKKITCKEATKIH